MYDDEASVHMHMQHTHTIPFHGSNVNQKFLQDVELIIKTYSYSSIEIHIKNKK